MGQTDPNLAFWEKFWLNFAEKSAIFGQNLLIWAEIVLRLSQNIFTCMHNWRMITRPSSPTDQIFGGIFPHPLGIYAYVPNWPINRPFKNKISFCVSKWVIPP